MEPSQHKQMFLKLVAGLTIAIGAPAKLPATTSSLFSIEERVQAVRAMEDAKADELWAKLPEGQSPSPLDLNANFSEAEIQLVQWGNWGNWGNWNNWNNWGNFANWNNWGNWANWGKS